MKNREDGFSRVRVSKGLIEALTLLLNQDVRVLEDGTLQRFETNRPLVGQGMYDASPSSATYIVNLALLGFMSGLLEHRKLYELIQETPSVGFESFRIATERLSPKSTVVVPTTVIEDMLNAQKELVTRLERYETMVASQDVKIDLFGKGQNRALSMLLDQAISVVGLDDSNRYDADELGRIEDAFMNVPADFSNSREHSVKGSKKASASVDKESKKDSKRSSTNDEDSDGSLFGNYMIKS